MENNWKIWLFYDIKFCTQQAVPFTGADDADADFLLPLTNFLTADNAAGA